MTVVRDSRRVVRASAGGWPLLPPQPDRGRPSLPPVPPYSGPVPFGPVDELVAVAAALNTPGAPAVYADCRASRL